MQEAILMKKTIEEDEIRLKERQRIETTSRERRLIQIDEMEKQINSLMDKSDKMREIEIKKIDDEYEIRKRREESELQARIQDEAVSNLEFKTHIKLQELLSQKHLEEQSRRMRLETLAKEKESVLKEKILNNKWKQEDEERKLSAQYRLNLQTKYATLEADLADKRYLQIKNQI